MSLINQVLQDLDRRGAERPGGVGPAEQVRPVAVVRREPRWPRLAAIAATAAAAAVVGWILLQEQPVPVSAAAAGLPSDIRPAGADAGTQGGAGEAAPSAGGGAVSRLSFELAEVPARREAAERLLPAPPQRAAVARAPAEPVPAAVPEPDAPKESQIVAHAAPHLPAVAAPKPADSGSIEKRVRQIEPPERTEAEFRKAVNLLQQGRVAEAIDALGTLLQTDPAHDPGRQALAGLYVEQKRPADAERVLREGVRVSPANGGFALALARLQLDRGDPGTALTTVQDATARGNGQAELHGFAAALLARDGRFREAAARYRAALAQVPGSAPWLIGLGIALEADGHPAEAQEAFTRARAARNLTPELQTFVDQRLRALQGR